MKKLWPPPPPINCPQAEVNLKEYEISQRKVAEQKLAKEKEARSKRIKQLEGERDEVEKSKEVLRSDITTRPPPSPQSTSHRAFMAYGSCSTSYPNKRRAITVSALAD